ncbi:hypothetical protein Leryth_001404 [Lithospermum erythrorhizon]|nr:hypothetical protein Leryth_001404 [Lithospermum erythrorhizon]
MAEIIDNSDELVSPPKRKHLALEIKGGQIPLQLCSSQPRQMQPFQPVKKVEKKYKMILID